MKSLLLSALGIILFTSLFAQNKSDCSYTLKFGTLSYQLCDGYDTVPKYNERGEIIADTIVIAELTRMYRVAPVQKLQSVKEVSVVKTNDQTSVLRIGTLKVVVKSSGASQSNPVQSSSINPALLEQLKALKKGDRVILSGITFYDAAKAVAIPINITIVAE